MNIMKPGNGQQGNFGLMGGFGSGGFSAGGLSGFGGLEAGGLGAFGAQQDPFMNQQMQMLGTMSAMLNVVMMTYLSRLIGMMQSGGGAAVSGGNPSFGGGGSGGGSPASNFLGGSSGAGGASGASSSGPAGPGVSGALDKARSMIGLQEGSDRAKIQEVTGKSGINPATTPWCAAFAMNILKDAGVLDLEGLDNRNYCPSIVSWAKKKGIFGPRGQYQPKPGDAIMFDWGSDGTSDHIGIVEKVENGKVITIEGNSSNSVKRNTYELGSSKIMGYVIGKNK